jgi:hypothetical protein
MLKDQTMLGKFLLLIAYATLAFVFYMIVPSYTYTTKFWKDGFEDVRFNLINAYGPKQ